MPNHYNSIITDDNKALVNNQRFEQPAPVQDNRDGGTIRAEALGSTPTPSVGGGSSTPREETIGDVFNRLKANGINLDENNRLRQFKSPGAELTNENDFKARQVDARQIQRDTMRRFQKEIDATNNVYDSLLNDARIEGQGRLGENRAISARSGVLGSDFGASAKEKVVGQNRDINRSIGAERSAAIQAIKGEGRKAAAAEIAAEREAAQGDLDNYLRFRETAADRKQAALSGLTQSLIDQGFDPNDMSPEEIAEIAREYETDEGTIISNFATENRVREQETLSASRDTDEFNLGVRKAEADISGVNARTAQTVKKTGLLDNPTDEDIDAADTFLETTSKRFQAFVREALASGKLDRVPTTAELAKFEGDFDKKRKAGKSVDGIFGVSTETQSSGRDTGVDEG